MQLTELEKTILLALYALGGGSTRKYIDKDVLVKKFPMRQRKSVRKYIEELAQKKLIVKKKTETEEKYRLNKKAMKEIVRIILKEGVRLRF